MNIIEEYLKGVEEGWIVRAMPLSGYIPDPTRLSAHNDVDFILTEMVKKLTKSYFVITIPFHHPDELNELSGNYVLHELLFVLIKKDLKSNYFVIETAGRNIKTVIGEKGVNIKRLNKTLNKLFKRKIKIYVKGV